MDGMMMGCSMYSRGFGLDWIGMFYIFGFGRLGGI